MMTTDTDTLAARFDRETPTEYATVLEYNGNRRVVLVAESLIDLYNGRRYALQSQCVDLGRWHTEAIIHSPLTAAIWLLADEA